MTGRERWCGGRNRPERPSERLRDPQPLIKRRIASGRGAMEQPNATGDGDSSLTPVFWMMVALTGVATGLFGDFLMWILFGILARSRPLLQAGQGSPRSTTCHSAVRCSGLDCRLAHSPWLVPPP